MKQESGGHGNLAGRVVTSLMWTGGGTIAQSIIRFVTLCILARLLEPSEFGVVSASVSVLLFFEAASAMGLNSAIIQRAELEDRHVQTAYLSNLLLGLFFATGLWSLAPYFAQFFGMQQVELILQILALTIPLRSVGLISEARVARDLEFRWLANMELLAVCLGNQVIAVICAYSGFGVWSLVVAEVSRAVIRSIMLLSKRPPLFGVKADLQAFWELWSMGAGFSLAKLANYAAKHGDNIVIGRALGPVGLGVYSRAYALMNVPAQLFTTPIGRVLFAGLSQVQQKQKKLQRGYLRGSALVALIMSPLALFCYVLGADLILFVLGPKWSDAVAPFQVLAIGMYFRAQATISDSLSRASGAVYRRAWRQMLNAALVVAGACIGQFWGLLGAVIGVMIALVIKYVIIGSLGNQLTGLRWRDVLAVQQPGLRLALLTGLVAWVCRELFVSWGLAGFGLLVGTCFVELMVLGIAVWQLPNFLLGPHGVWMLGYMQSLLRSKRRRSTQNELVESE